MAEVAERTPRTGSRWTRLFEEGHAGQRDLLGGKGAGLAEMSRIGLPVPPGFTITTEACLEYIRRGRELPEGLMEEVREKLKVIEERTGRRFGDPRNPLLLSVRSGAKFSMPGMMDTVLNLGSTPSTLEGLITGSGDARFAYDSYRRFIQMYSNVVLDIDHHLFEERLEDFKDERGYTLDTDLEGDDWAELIRDYKTLVERERGEPFPQDPEKQLWGAIGAVFASWMNQRAITYRKLHNIPEGWGTAVNVQAMVFGNMGETSATGVAFTRNPSTGDKALYGEFLVNAQGEDVVAGIRTPQPLTTAMKASTGGSLPSMEELMPDTFAELTAVFDRLEAHYRDMQDIEFTVQNGRLWILQTRRGKRSTQAALRIAVEMAEEGVIDRDEAVARIDPASLDQLLHPMLDPDAPREVIARGLPASPGAVSGRVVFSADEAERLGTAGEAVILVRIETSPEDIHGMHAARGILTSRGGMTSHAAVVARGMGKPCVCAAAGLAIDYRAGRFTVAGQTVAKGDRVTIDGSAGTVMLGVVPTVDPQLSGEFATLMGWADQRRRLKVRTNAETPEDARTARRFGAEGIGLCRTEHMFFDEGRIVAMREMILAGDAEGRRAALAKILPVQRQDLIELFEIMAGLPVTIRLLDPPLHEFLPDEAEDIAAIAKVAGVDAEALRRRASELREVNPMLGLRGCRLGVLFPEIYEMQARAIFGATVAVAQNAGQTVVPEVMVPLIATARELELIKAEIDRVAKEVMAESGLQIDYQVGTMIEVPRAALCAEEIARLAEFFSFGTNDLTQMALGLSRDDSAKFMELYRERGIFEADPFTTLDVEGVGALVELACERGRRGRPELKLGICGEHGGDPATIGFCERVGLDYVSCSPYRVPIARLAAAQATLRAEKAQA
ncbi:MAG: pyruvate, phosphate dikinase [bacterium]